jgi:oxaloacetate decarboxylase alpha subunit
MKDYLRGYYGKAPGPMDKEVVAKVLGGETPLSADVRPGSLVTTTYDEVAAEVGELARSEEDVLMYALFPNEARTYLTAHREGAENAVFLMSEEIHTVREEDPVDVNQIRELIKVIEASDVTEVVIEEGDSKVTVRKAGAFAAVASAPVAAPPAASPVADAAAETAAPSPGARPGTWKTVIAPMVGTFYAAGAPGAAPFVSVGDNVSAGQTLCIIEAMKLMNEITADEDGVIREIAIENGEAVEYGTVMFYYEPV